jgi:DNA-binding CsgD family transcriptional regulator/N-acetylneuraminic acid mutarotase
MSDKNLLSDREIEILQLVATGLTNREIAQSLTISPNTVKVHLRNIFEKINVSSRTEATLYGIEHGMVDVPGINGDSLQAAPATADQQTNLTFIAIIVLVILVIAAFGSNIFFPQSNQTPISMEDLPDRWQELAPLPKPRSSMAAVAYDREIFVIAGDSLEGVSGSVFRYNTDTNLWERLEDKPHPVTDVDGVLIGEKIYIPGGRSENGQPTNVLDVYDIRLDVWEKKSPMPIAVSGYALAAYEGRIYLFGGWDGDAVLDIVLTYDPIDDRWDYGTPMPTARAYSGAAVANGKIFVIGGWNGTVALDVNESYTPSRDAPAETAWELARELPEAGYGIGVESLADIVFVLGDNGVWQYSARTDTWNYDESKLPIDFDSNFGFTSLESYMFVIGGSDSNSQNISHVFRYQAIYSLFIPIINGQ